MEKKFYRDPSNKILGGVCSGLAEYLSLDINIVRILTAVLGLSGAGLVAYIVAWVIVPEKPAQ